jgi:hypothetical protein
MQAGDSIDQVLAAYPRYIKTLKPLLQAAQEALEYSHTIQIPDDAQAESRRVFIETAQEIIPQPKRFSFKQLTRRMVLPIGLLVLAILALWPVLTVARTALPGDLLYSLKRLNESVLFALESSNTERLYLEIKYDQERLVEVEKLIQLGQTGPVEFSGGLVENNTTVWQVSSIQVLIQSDTRLIGTIETGFYVRVQGYLKPDGSVYAYQIQPVEYLFQGQIQSIAQDKWVVDGIEIQINPETSILGDPEIGKQAQMGLQLTLEGKLTARLIEVFSR